MCIPAKIDTAVVDSHVAFLKECISKHLEGPREHLASFGKLVVLKLVNLFSCPAACRNIVLVEKLLIPSRTYSKKLENVQDYVRDLLKSLISTK